MSSMRSDLRPGKVAICKIAATDHSPAIVAVEIAWQDEKVVIGPEKPLSPELSDLVDKLIQEAIK